MQVPKTLDETARNEVWREHCRKEASIATTLTQYRVTSPERMTLLPEKPNKTIPKFARPDSGEARRAEELLQSLSKSKHSHQTPAEAYSAPITSNMAYGFLPQRYKSTHKMFDHKMGKSEITAYAEACARQGVKPTSGTKPKSATAK
ncbi:hypothetical protein WJX73_007281 [Symbiochloris irregularis]|uniref:Uncharacterized protein n=1 Tax=Symbiochloris irregularis TaxID=706552 RepID=A0AAW1PQX4_9CHLO